uniref:Uncharacterized protein n=1 Tax=Sphingobacterium sp. (strain 21) TaxID=743722 RepID=F4C1A6_SPHS2
MNGLIFVNLLVLKVNALSRFYTPHSIFDSRSDVSFS